VTFHLGASDPDFLYVLTLPFAYAVPAGSPDALAKGDTSPATGPYVIDRYDPGKEVALARNPTFRTWSVTARPGGFADQIVWRLGPDGEQMVADTLKGEGDIVFSPPPARIAELATSHAGQLHLSPRANTFFMTMNTRVAPFDDVRVRQALNFAVDRAEVELLSGGMFRATCQILPPTLPGYAPYCPYTRRPNATWTAPDLAKAQELVDTSGTAGTKVTVWASEQAFPPSVPIGRYFRDLLERLGYRSTLKVVSPAQYFPAVFGEPSGRRSPSQAGRPTSPPRRDSSCRSSHATGVATTQLSAIRRSTGRSRRRVVSTSAILLEPSMSGRRSSTPWWTRPPGSRSETRTG
jgi:peptide/nickel transport system substrate-binding protein